MKRDIDLIRKILLRIEEYEYGFIENEIKIESFTADQIGFHVHLIGEAGLAKVIATTNIQSTSPQAMPICLTWDGYEFLEAAKDETLWSKAKSVIIKPAGGVAFTVLLEWLKTEAKTKLGLP
ncbi:MAG: DUF2513 domain-containing protein [Burkholderiaceae bacterium]|nr:DUF2513 domain-containing protein [Burkholderiaceae bacterium]